MAFAVAMQNLHAIRQLQPSPINDVTYRKFSELLSQDTRTGIAQRFNSQPTIPKRIEFIRSAVMWHKMHQTLVPPIGMVLMGYFCFGAVWQVGLGAIVSIPTCVCTRLLINYLETNYEYKQEGANDLIFFTLKCIYHWCRRNWPWPVHTQPHNE